MKKEVRNNMANSTTFDYGHVHRWDDGDKYTETKMFHKHKINLNTMKAEKGNNDHDHKLLK